MLSKFQNPARSTTKKAESSERATFVLILPVTYLKYHFTSLRELQIPQKFEENRPLVNTFTPLNSF